MRAIKGHTAHSSDGHQGEKRDSAGYGDQQPLTSRSPDALQDRSGCLAHCGHVQAPEATNVRTRSEEQRDDAGVARRKRKLQSSLTPRIDSVNESSVIEQQLHSFWLL